LAPARSKKSTAADGGTKEVASATRAAKIRRRVQKLPQKLVSETEVLIRLFFQAPHFLQAVSEYRKLTISVF